MYQEILMELSVAENIFLGRMPSNKFGWIDIREANKRAQEIINEFGLQIKPQTKVKDLSIAYYRSNSNARYIAFGKSSSFL